MPTHLTTPPGAPRPRGRWRMLLALPLAFALMAPGAGALAAESTTGYSQTTPPPTKTETTTTGYKQTPTTPAKTETAPAKQEVSPKTESEATTTPAKSEPAHEVAPTSAPRAHAARLPFTGLDLRWIIVGAVALMGTGLSLLLSQRGRRRTQR